MATAMKGVTKALTQMNKKINLPGLQKIMAEFMKENEKADITAEMIGDTLDDAMEEEGSAEEEDLIVGQVLDELGVNMSQETPSAPIGNVGKQEAKADEAQGNECSVFGFLPVNHVLPQFYNVLFCSCVISTFRVCRVGFRGAPSKTQVEIKVRYFPQSTQHEGRYSSIWLYILSFCQVKRTCLRLIGFIHSLKTTS